jgi:hypothetical protein
LFLAGPDHIEHLKRIVEKMHAEAGAVQAKE